jgi:hypothetical protein
MDNTLEPETSVRSGFYQKDDHVLHVLFVIPRIRSQIGAAYQSTGMRLVNGLCKKCREYFQLEVLHAPTYARLVERLEKAQADGRPFHILHYDGHGAFQKPSDLGSQGRLIRPPEDEHKEEGYLLLENAEKPDFVDGLTLGSLLVKNKVAILSLNACHSPASPEEEALVRLAFEAVIAGCRTAGLPGVLAIPNFSESDAAAVYLGDVYAALAQGQSLGQAAASEQRYLSALASHPKGTTALALNDWRSAVIFESVPLRIAEEITFAGAPIFRISILDRGQEIKPERMDPRLIKWMPDGGVHGRDEQVLMLEQVFDYHSTLLLFGEIGAGKTCTAAEFARWQANNGAYSDLPIIYTSMAGCANLTEVLEEFGQVYEGALLERHLVWNELEDFQREKLIKDVLKKVPLLWIWDDFEKVSQDLVTPWEAPEQKRLVDFMKSLSDTSARLLIISNNPEKDLGEDIVRVRISPLAQSSLASLLRSKMEGRPAPGIDEKAALALIGSGPVNLKVLDIFLKHPDLFTSHGPISSLNELAASTMNALGQADQRLFSLAALFTLVLNSDVLVEMGNPQRPWCLPEIKGVTLAQVQATLSRAEALGLITFISGRYYLLDAALLNDLAPVMQKGFSPERAYRAFFNAMSILSRDLVQQWQNGDKEQIGLLEAEETNLKRAFLLAHRYEGRSALVGLLTGLRLVYIQHGRYGPWARLLDTIAADFLTVTGKLSRAAGRDAIFFVECCVEVSQLRQRFSEAANWQQLRVDWERWHAAEALRADPQMLEPDAVQKAVSLASAVAARGALLLKAGDPKAVDAYKEAFQAVKRLKKSDLAAQYAYWIAHGYIVIPAGQDLQMARRWIKKSLSLRAEADHLGRGQTMALFARVSLEKIIKGQKENRPAPEQVGYINEGLGYLFDALDLLPEEAHGELGFIHETIGHLYFQSANAVDTALEHYDQAIHHKEQAQDGYGAAKASFNAAVALFLLTRFELGRGYALRALSGFEALGATGAEDVQKTRGLLAKFTSATG